MHTKLLMYYTAHEEKIYSKIVIIMSILYHICIASKGNATKAVIIHIMLCITILNHLREGTDYLIIRSRLCFITFSLKDCTAIPYLTKLSYKTKITLRIITLPWSIFFSLAIHSYNWFTNLWFPHNIAIYTHVLKLLWFLLLLKFL